MGVDVVFTRLFYTRKVIMSETQKRYRNFATIIYADSAPVDWQEILAKQCIPAFISPLHDKDKTAVGEPKKPHYHVLLMFDGKKSAEQVKEILKLIGGVGCEVVNSMRGYARYLCHLDDPNKAQYDQGLVKSLCGADYIATIGLPTDKYKAIGEMIDFCQKNHIYAFSDLLEFSRAEHCDWFRVLCDSGTVVMKEYLKSRAWKDRT